MKIVQIIALSATLFAGASAAYASPFDAMGGSSALDALSDAHYATVETVSAGAASSLRFDTDVASLQARINNNKAIAAQLASQGYSASDVIGIDNTSAGSNVVLYVL